MRPSASHTLPGSIVLFAMLLFASDAVVAASLSASAQAKVRTATFEVVVAKPEHDSLTYERALPLELLPFNVRNDKYFSIGTAFAIGKNTYVTAAHVLRIGQRSQFGAPALRSADGQVYAIENILKYSLGEDFVVFSLQHAPSDSALKTETHAKVDSTVFAVGNALGDGIVIRDGVYTSDTPEARDGRWKWVRFSAAASPGNSGGPLLNDDGKVIAVITMKSPNENLNYALPITRVLDAKNNLAVVDTRSTYHLDIFDSTETQTLKFEVNLPLSMAQLAEVVAEKQNAFSQQLLQALLAKESPNTFPNGDGAQQLLNAPHGINFPALIVRNSSGRWDTRVPDKVANVQLSPDAHAFFAVEQQLFVMRMQRPGDIAAEKFYDDSKIFGDLFLKAVPLNRSVGQEKVRLTSMGAAARDDEFVDHYQRKWRLRVWNLEFQDSAVVALSLPCPEGYISLFRAVPTALIDAVASDFKALADFIYTPYSGTFAQWQDFLAQNKLLPGAFSKLQLSFDYERGFNYRSPRFAFSYTPALFKLSKDSVLGLSFAYLKDGDQVVWDVYTLAAYENKNNKTAVHIVRTLKPGDELADQIKDNWRRISNREHPYDSAPFSENDRTVIRQVLATPHSAGEESNVRYTVGYAAEGKQADALMKEKLALAVKRVEVLEK